MRLDKGFRRVLLGITFVVAFALLASGCALPGSLYTIPPARTPNPYLNSYTPAPYPPTEMKYEAIVEPTAPPPTPTAAPQSVTTPPPATVTPTAGQRYTTALYRDVLGREPDGTGLTYWDQDANAGNYSQVAQGFVYSHEYNIDTVTKGYQDCLGRSPDPQGLTYWVGQMDGGMSPEGMLAGLMESNEFLGNNSGGNAAGTQAYYTGVVTGFYNCALRRAPEAQGLPFWINNLMGGAMTIPQAVNGFLSSQEYLTDVINYNYQTFLRRAGSAQDVAWWVAQLQGGLSTRQAQVGFLTSPEYINDVTSQ
jgi:hypothetical protein